MTPSAHQRTKGKSSSGGGAGGRGKPVDVTGTIDESEDDYQCGICAQYDPPEMDETSGGSVSVGWVGCDCDRWFHKQCTKLSRFTDRFSCRSVKMKCLRKNAAAASHKKRKRDMYPGASTQVLNQVVPPTLVDPLAGEGGDLAQTDPFDYNLILN